MEVVSRRDPWLVHAKLDLIVKSGALAERAVVVDLKDYRARLWCGWTADSATCCRRVCTRTGPTCRDVRVTVVDARLVRFEHEDLKVIARVGVANRLLDVCTVARDCAGVLFIDGKYIDTCCRVCTPSGATRRKPRWSKSTCAKRCWMSAARKS